MPTRLQSTLGVLALAAVAEGCRRESPQPPAAPASADRPAESAPARENDRGIIGGPIDETAFEFDIEPATEDDRPPLLDGVPEIPEELAARMAPYLRARRTRISSVTTGGEALVVLTRRDAVAQAYRVDEPGGELHPLTSGHDPVAQAVFVPGRPDQLLFRRDHDGDENYQFFRRSLSTGEETLLTDGKSRHSSFALLRTGQMAYASNQRAPGDMDIYLAHVIDAYAPRRIVERGGQWTVVSFSPGGDRLLLRHYESAESSSVHIWDQGSGTLLPISLGRDAASMRSARFSSDPDVLYLVSDAGGDFAQLIELRAGEATSLTEDIPWNVELMAISADRSTLAYSVNEDGASRLYVQNLATGERRSARGLPTGVVSSLQFLGAGHQLALTLAIATEPADAYVYDPASDELARWTESEDDALERKPFVEPSLVRVTSFDGEQVPTYLYAPAGPGPHPALLWVHGGPEQQHRPSLDPLLQFFVVELGIAVVAPNIRGSTGYGRRYLALDNGIRRSDAVRDVGALLDWIGEHPELDASRVGIYGASYGGFIVLAALAAYGDRIAAGCDLVGISHLPRFLEATSAYRRDLRRAEYGDERDPDIRAELESVSPLNQADRIRSPLFVGHGQNDPRVPVTEAEQIVEAVRREGNEVWYMLARDEGHGFRKKRSRDLFYTAMALFFAKHLSAPVSVDPETGPAAVGP